MGINKPDGVFNLRVRSLWLLVVRIHLNMCIIKLYSIVETVPGFLNQMKGLFGYT
jgi:hypothetical protein